MGLSRRPAIGILLGPFLGLLIFSCETQHAAVPKDLPNASADSKDTDIFLLDSDSGDLGSPDAAESLWPVVCGDEYPCSGEFRGNPTPFDTCDVPRRYWTCPNDSCVPDDGSLLDFYQTWLAVGPELLGMNAGEFASHVFLNALRLDTLADGRQSYRAQFLVAFDWVLAAEEHTAIIAPGVMPTGALFEDALRGEPANHFCGLPEGVVSFDRVHEIVANCDPSIEIRLCHLFFNKLASDRGSGFWLREVSETDESTGYCWVVDVDLVSAEFDCRREVR